MYTAKSGNTKRCANYRAATYLFLRTSHTGNRGTKCTANENVDNTRRIL